MVGAVKHALIARPRDHFVAIRGLLLGGIKVGKARWEKSRLRWVSTQKLHKKASL